MTQVADATRVRSEQIPSAAGVLARAFFDDPLFVWMEPDDARRERLLPWLMRIAVQYGSSFGEVHGTADSLRGAAVWLPPGASIVDPARLEQAGFTDPVHTLGESALHRFGAFMEHAEQLHLRDMAASHWYLMVLGVDPPYQGQGLGGAVMQPVLRRADDERLPCYLETAKERNLAFYRKHGFEIVHEGTLPDAGPRFWTMRRNATS